MLFGFPASSLAIVALASSSYAASIAGRADLLIECLRSSLSPQGSVLTPGQPLFANDTARYSELYAPTFRVVSVVANEHDVRVSVCAISRQYQLCLGYTDTSKIKCASKTNSTFLVTGLRHGFYKGLEKLQNGLEIYTGVFNNVTVDPAANTLTCGGATNFQQIIDAAFAAKKILREFRFNPSFQVSFQLISRNSYWKCHLCRSLGRRSRRRHRKA